MIPKCIRRFWRYLCLDIYFSLLYICIWSIDVVIDVVWKFISTLYDSRVWVRHVILIIRERTFCQTSFVMWINRVDEYTSDQAPTPEVDIHKNIAQTRIHTLRMGMRPTHSTHPSMEPPIPKKKSWLGLLYWNFFFDYILGNYGSDTSTFIMVWWQHPYRTV